MSIPEYLSYDQVLQDRGYKPIIIFSSVNGYDDFKYRRIISHNIPLDIRNDVLSKTLSGGISSGVAGVTTESLKSRVLGRISSVAGEINDTLSDISGTVDDDKRAFEGCMIDLTIPEGQGGPQNYSWANIIFQNPLAVSPSGDQFFGSDFLKYGFPVWIQIGYLDGQGRIVSHPFSDTYLEEPEIVFGGLIGSLTQEMTLQAGDRMLVQGVDYSWYFENFLLGQHGKDDTFSIQVGKGGTPLEIAINDFFKYFLEDGGADAPKAIMQAMGFKVYETVSSKAPTVEFDKRVPKTKTPVKGKGTLGDAMEDNYLTILNRLQDAYNVDINWKPQSIWETKIVVTPRLDPYSMAFDKSGKIDPLFDLKIHQAILGGNVRNWTFAVDAAGSANRLLVRVVKPETGEPEDVILLTKATIDEILEQWKQRDDLVKGVLGADLKSPSNPDVLVNEAKTKGEPLFGVKYPTVDDLDKVFGKQTKALELIISRDAVKDKGEGLKLPSGKVLPLSEEAVQTIVRRLHYWGAKGSVMLMGNPSIKQGDLIEVFDRRPKGTTSLGFQPDIAEKSMTSFLERYKTRLEEIKKGLSTNYKKTRYLGMAEWDNVYYVWKVDHYLGPEGYWTKVHYVKQRDAITASRSQVFKTMRERAKKKKEDI